MNKFYHELEPIVRTRTNTNPEKISNGKLVMFVWFVVIIISFLFSACLLGDDIETIRKRAGRDKEKLHDLAGTVSITGINKVGETLTADISKLEGTGVPSYQWSRGDSAQGVFSPIADETEATYTLTEMDLYNFIIVTVNRDGYIGSVTAIAVYGSNFDLSLLEGVWVLNDNEKLSIHSYYSSFELITAPGDTLPFRQSVRGNISYLTDNIITVNKNRISSNGGSNWILASGEETIFYSFDNEGKLTLWTILDAIILEKGGDGNVLRWNQSGSSGDSTPGVNDPVVTLIDVKPNTDYTIRYDIKVGSGHFNVWGNISTLHPNGGNDHNSFGAERVNLVSQPLSFLLNWTKREHTFKTGDYDLIAIHFRSGAPVLLDLGFLGVYEGVPASITNESVNLYSNPYFINTQFQIHTSADPFSLSADDYARGAWFTVHWKEMVDIVPGDNGRGRLVTSADLVDTNIEYGPFTKQ